MPEHGARADLAGLDAATHLAGPFSARWLFRAAVLLLLKMFVELPPRAVKGSANKEMP
jgi:hypothetical protein